MKKSEIETIITATPEAIFTENTKFGDNFIIVGFAHHHKNKYSNGTIVALVKRVYFYKGEASIADTAQRKSLRTIVETQWASLKEYETYSIQKEQRQQNAVQYRKQQQELMNDIKPELHEALKACGIDNKAWNFNDPTFKIEVDVDNAEQLLKVLQAFAAQQVTA